MILERSDGDVELKERLESAKDIDIATFPQCGFLLVGNQLDFSCSVVPAAGDQFLIYYERKQLLAVNPEGICSISSLTGAHGCSIPWAISERGNEDLIQAGLFIIMHF